MVRGCARCWSACPTCVVVGVGEWPQWLRIVIAIDAERPRVVLWTGASSRVRDGHDGQPTPHHFIAQRGETPAQQGFRMERTTGFEPATLTLAR